MTAPVHSPAEQVTALLDQLDELRAAATPGEWHVATGGGIDAGDYDTVIGRGDVDCMSHCYGGTSTIEGDNLPADAALIVAAVNAIPELTTALREVLELADRWRREGERLGDDGCIHVRHGKAIQFAIGDALHPDAPLAGQHTTGEEPDRG